jgi:hypothetical protein
MRILRRVVIGAGTLTAIVVLYFMASAGVSRADPESCIRATQACNDAQKAALDCVAKNPLTSAVVCSSAIDVKNWSCNQVTPACQRPAPGATNKK